MTMLKESGDKIDLKDFNFKLNVTHLLFAQRFVKAWSKIDELITVEGIHQNTFIMPSFSHFSQNEKPKIATSFLRNVKKGSYFSLLWIPGHIRNFAFAHEYIGMTLWT